MISEAVAAHLHEIGQQHLLEGFQHLPKPEQDRLSRQLEGIKPSFYREQVQFLRQPVTTSFDSAELPSIDQYGAHRELGFEAMRNGKCALVVLAGGQGSRLRCHQPKGCFPLSPLKKKSLFQLLAEKVVAASKWVHRPLELVVMTSPLNHIEVENFFMQHGYFGLSLKQVSFVQQKMWPLLDFENKYFLEKAGKLAMGPDGNGGLFRLLKEHHFLDRWEDAGVTMVRVIPIDNPLADPFDAAVFGYHKAMQHEVVVQGVEKQTPDENAGELVLLDGKVGVIEYSELPPQFSAGHLINVGLYSFSLSFLRKAAAHRMPLHVAKKTVLAHGEKVLPESPNAYKFERFIFDALPLSESTGVLETDRGLCFAPLKNFQGADSIATVQESLLKRDRAIFERVTGLQATGDIELGAPFYYNSGPVESDGKTSGYIEGV